MWENFKLFVDTFTLVLFIILMILVLYQYQTIHRMNKKINRLRRRYDILFQGETDLNLEEILNQQSKSIQANNKLMQRLQQDIAECNERTSSAIRKIGFHNYDAYDYLQNKLSYTLVLLDNDNNGILLTSIFGEEQSSSFSKEIWNGKCGQKLSDDEKIALDKALSGGIRGNKKDSKL